MAQPILNTGAPAGFYVPYAQPIVERNTGMVTVLLILLLVWFVWKEVMPRLHKSSYTPAPGDAASRVPRYVRDDIQMSKFTPYAGYEADRQRLDFLTNLKVTKGIAGMTEAEKNEYYALYAKVATSADSSTYSQQIFDDYNPSGIDGKPIPSTACSLYSAEQAEADVNAAAFKADTSRQGQAAVTKTGGSESMTDADLRRAMAGH